MNKTISIIIASVLIFGIGVILFGRFEKNTTIDTAHTQNVEIRDGVQYVTITARGGYAPRVSTAAADISTQLIIKTNGTYDCSAALVIRSLGYQKMLPQSGEEVIDVGVPKVGELQGMCSMGMYSFVVNFE